MKQGSCYVLGFQHRCIFPILTFSSSVIILLALRSPDQNPIKLVCNTSVSFVYLIQQYQTLFVPRGYSADLACYFNLCPGLEILLSCTPCCYYCFYLWWLCSLWVYISPTHSFFVPSFQEATTTNVSLSGSLWLFQSLSISTLYLLHKTFWSASKNV